jgi:hypothetical protein
MTRDFTSLRADIRRELSSLDRLAAETEQLLARIPDHPSFVEIRAAGSLLHDFYTGAEKVFQRIALEMEGGLPAGAEWHSELLARMATPVEDRRPAVISEELKDQLGEYLRFRHLFRYMYGFQLRWERCQVLLSVLPGIKREFERQLHIFLDFLRSLEKS